MDFFLFLLVNATLFIRPGEIIPATEGWPIYNVIIIANLIVAGPAIINHLTEHGLSRCPTTACVLGVLFFVVFSHLAHFNFWSARVQGLEFSKVVAYFLLLMAIVNSRQRLFLFLAAIVLFTVTVNVLSVLQFHGRIDIPALAVVFDRDYDELTGDAFEFPRMCAMGIFSDPNDLSMIIVASIMICLCGLFTKYLGMARFLLAAPIGFLGYALTLTQSRGGLLALIAGVVVLLFSRFGPIRAGILASALVPLALVGFGGRQSDLGGALSGGTGETRAELWSEGLEMFKAEPLFGIGQGEFVEQVRQVAHNSFVHAFIELGIFGGMAFLGVFAYTGWSLWRLRRAKDEIDDPVLLAMLPFVIGLLAAFAVSMMSLSRCYMVPTYLVAGLGACYERLARPETSLPPVEINPKSIAWLSIGSAGLIVVIYLYIKVLFRMG